jgi:hypothetical protein
MCHVLLCKIGLLIISFIHVGNRGNYISFCVTPNGMKFLWWTCEYQSGSKLVKLACVKIWWHLA